jgi:hypothetical protein
MTSCCAEERPLRVWTCRAGVMISPDGNPCAWCQKEKGIARLPWESHSICPRHRAQLLKELE